MPELPEVETLGQRLTDRVVGSTIKAVQVLNHKNFIGNPSTIVGSQITFVGRRAKTLVFGLSTGAFLASHLKMTGQFLYQDSEIRVGGGHPTADWVRSLPSEHTRIIFDLDGDAQLFFNDQRTFGWIAVMHEAAVRAHFAQIGPDIVETELLRPVRFSFDKKSQIMTFSADYLATKLHGRKRAIKLALLDQSVVAGLGNIYVCDALNRARISPVRPSATLKKSEIIRLSEACQSVIRSGIELGGATISEYADIDGFSGSYQTKVLTYGREGQPCFNCGGAIEKIKLGGRGTYYCPNCQR